MISPLRTMRYKNFQIHDLPYNLKCALEGYDQLRRKMDYEAADEWAKQDPGPGLARLLRGLKRTTYRGLLSLAGPSHIDASYVRKNTNNFKDLMFLFYWNGDEDLTRRILLNAWRKGKAK